MKRKAISLLIIFSLVVLLIPITRAPPVDEWITETIDEDLFYAAYLFDGVDMIYLQGQNMQIRGWYWLEGPVLDARRHVIEAYLSVRCPGIGATDPNATMTIYGKPSGVGGTPSYYDNPSAINGPYTTNSYDVNISAFVGPAWHNITVTNIVREINQGHYFYDGHDIAFVTLSPSGQAEERYVSSEESGYAAILYVHYGEPVAGPPAPGYEWIEDYRNHTIWRQTVFNNASMAMYFEDQGNAFDIYYGDFAELEADGTDHVFIIDNLKTIQYSSRNTITRVNDTIVLMEYPGNQVVMRVSTDEGATWSNHILNDQFTDLAAHGFSKVGSMWTDVNGTTHLAWQSYTDTSPAAYRGLYSNFTLFVNGTLNYYDGFHEFATGHNWQNIETDQHGRIHIAYDLADVLSYTFRNASGWQAPEIIRNTGDSLLEFNIDVAVHPNASRPPVVRFVYQRQWVGNEYVEQTIRESDGTLSHTLLSSNNAFRANSGMYFGGNKSVATYADNPGGGSSEIEYRIFNFTDMSLTGARYVTPTAQAHHFQPDIAIDEGTGIAYFVWQNTFSDSGTWTRRFDLNTTTFIDERHSLIAPMNVQFAQITPTQTGGAAYYNWIVTDENDTVVMTDNQSTCMTIECFEDLVDEDVFGYPDPEDPDPPGWDTPGTGLLTRFNFKTIIFLIGMILFAGTPVYGFAERPDGATWIIIFFSMFCGVALLWSLQTM